MARGTSQTMDVDAFIELVEGSSSDLTAVDVEVRKTALQRIVATLSLVDVRQMSIEQGESLIEFFCAKLADHHSLVPFSLRGVYELVIIGKYTVQSATRFCNAVFVELHMGTLKYAERRCLLAVVCAFVNDSNILRELRTSFGDSGFTSLVVQVVDGERDPRNLKLVFELLETVARTCELRWPGVGDNGGVEGDGELLFESFACYFPVDFDDEDAEADGVVVTRELLVEALQRCFTSNAAFLGASLEIALEKLSSSVKAAKLDSLRLLGALLERFGVGRPAELHAKTLRTAASEWNKFSLPLLEIVRKEVFYTQSADLETAALDAFHKFIRELSWQQDGTDENAETRQQMLTAVLTQLCRTCRTSLFDRDLKLIIPTLKMLREACRASQRAALNVADSLLPAFLEKFEVLERSKAEQSDEQECDGLHKLSELASVLLEFTSEVARVAVHCDEQQLAKLAPVQRLLHYVDRLLMDLVSGNSASCDSEEFLRVLAELSQCCVILLRHDSDSRTRLIAQFDTISSVLHLNRVTMQRESRNALMHLLTLLASLFNLSDKDNTLCDDVTAQLSAISAETLRRTLGTFCGANGDRFALEKGTTLRTVVEVLFAHRSIVFLDRDVPAVTLCNQMARQCFFAEFWPKCEATIIALLSLPATNVQSELHNDWLCLFTVCLRELPADAQWQTASRILQSLEELAVENNETENRLNLLIELAKLLPKVEANAGNAAEQVAGQLERRYLQNGSFEQCFKHENSCPLATLRALVANKFASESTLESHLQKLSAAIASIDNELPCLSCVLLLLNAMILRGVANSIAVFQQLADKCLACNDMHKLQQASAAFQKLCFDLQRAEQQAWRGVQQARVKPLFVQRFAYAAVSRLQSSAQHVRLLFFVVAALPSQVQSLLRDSLLPHCFAVLSSLRASDDAELAGVVLDVLRRFLQQQVAVTDRKSLDEKRKDGCCGGGCKDKQSGSQCHRKSPAVSQVQFATVCDACLAIARNACKMHVRLAALQCLDELLDAFPRFYITPHEQQVVTQLRVCLNDPKRLVREQAWRTRGAWLLAGAPEKQ